MFLRLPLKDRFCKLHLEDQLGYNCICTLQMRFQGINFLGSSEIHKNSEIFWLQKFSSSYTINKSMVHMVQYII